MILAFDTTMGACSVACWADGDVRASRFDAIAQGHAEALLPMIETVLGEACADLSQITLIGVTHGPGSFTGCRIGIAAARMLALAYKTPIDVRSTLGALAATGWDKIGGPGRKPVVVVIDARRDQFYLQSFLPAATLADLRAHTEPMLIARENVMSKIPTQGAFILTDAAQTLQTLSGGAEANDIIEIGPEPDASALIRWVAAKPEPAEPDTVRPLYLRPPDAKRQVPPAWLSA